MKKVLVCGHTNLETTVAVEAFPIEYTPMRYPFFGIQTAVAEVGYNIAKALTTLGSQVHFLTLVEEDIWGEQVKQQAAVDGLGTGTIVAGMPSLPPSTISIAPARTLTSLWKRRSASPPTKLALTVPPPVF